MSTCISISHSSFTVDKETISDDGHSVEFVGFGIAEDANYAITAVYPYALYENKWDITIQEGTAEGLKDYDIMTAQCSVTNGVVGELQFTHQCAFIHIPKTVQVATDSYNGSRELQLSGDNVFSTCSVNFEDGSLVFGQDAETVSVTIEVENGYPAEDVYIAFFPKNTTDTFDYTLKVIDGVNNPVKTLENKTVSLANAYKIGDVYRVPVIEFKDEKVKAICVANWDKDGDGELSEAEAAAVTSIGTKFRNNKNIEYFPELQYFVGLTGISSATSTGNTYAAFYGCTSLKEIVLPEGLTYVGNSSFSGCTSLTDITLPSTLKSIYSSAFSSCKALTNIDLSECTRLNSIGNSAFSSCTALTNIDLSKCTSLSSIDYNAFKGCTILSSVIFSASVSNIGNSAFEGCTALTNIDLSECTSLNSIGNSAFSGCTKLSSVIFSASISSIGASAFTKDPITAVEFPENSLLASIGTSAFKSCTALTKVDLSNCNNLLYLTGTNITEDSAWGSTLGQQFFECTALTDIVFPAKLQTIGYRTFWKCTSLKDINFPKTLTGIGYDAFFSGNTSKIITCYAETPPTFYNSSGVSEDSARQLGNAANVSKIYVPSASVDTYKAASGWNKFATKIGAISE